MNKLLHLSLLSSLLITGISSANEHQPFFIAKDSTETKMTFNFFVQINGPKEPTQKKIETQIENQVAHLFGPMGFAEVLAVPKGDHRISNVGKPKRAKRGWTVDYTYEGTVIVQLSPLLVGDTYEVLLPYNPATIYRASGKVKGKNPCTDDHYQDEGDFWYFWSPDYDNCRLQEGRDYAVVKTQIQRIPNTVSTYPEYNKLIRSIDGKETILISFFVGMDEPNKHDHNPITSKDTNATNYRDIRKRLLSLGFKEGDFWTQEQLNKHIGKVYKEQAHVQEYVKETTKAKIVVRMFFGETGDNEKIKTFHALYREALESSSVMIYNGHSGLGGHLDLDAIEQTNKFNINMSKDYQIYYFNSCSSYTYYNTQYFARKKSSGDPRGTKGLDIVTNGLATAFFISHDTDMALVKAIHGWASNEGAVVSYQDLARAIDDENLAAINGDEDNPTTAPLN